jgi:hypothetical protein
MPKAAEVVPVPHSWTLADWPTHVFPGDARKGRYLVRIYRAELVKARVVARLGKQIIIRGGPFCNWLSKKILTADDDFSRGAARARRQDERDSAVAA